MSQLTNARQAEELIAQLLAHQRWQILARNWRRRGCELDIVALHMGTLAIVEVKYRRRYLRYAADISTMIHQKKISALRRGALLYLGENSLAALHTIRLDLAVVSPSKEKAKEHLPHIRYYANVVPL